MKIDKNIDVPIKKKWVDLTKEMKIGDSVLLDKKSAKTLQVTFILKLGKGSAQRKAEGEKIRIWRIK